MAYHAAHVLVVASVHRDGGVHRAVLDGVGLIACTFFRESHESGSMGRTRDAALDGHILNYCAAADVAEGSRALSRCLADVDVERLAIAVKRSCEGVVA